MLRRILQNTVVFVYLTVTAAAMVYTMSRISLLPRLMIRWSYGMMAPYQGDTAWNGDFLYEGQLPDGTWERIDIDAYMPFGFGERNARKFLRVYDDETRRTKYPQFASLLLERERAKGRDYQAVRVYFDMWDRSPAGFEFLHTPLFTKRKLLTEVQ
ncbi:MAG: hypothetical protein HOO67_03570 [Candidatus Peribacteraceae bacterium]|nr:hypothetical protein [Candidatus Peribacteraceae bacterium]